MASSRITGTNENISTYGTLGMGRDYDVLADWEAFTDNDLVTATTSEVLECYDDAASFDDACTIAGATTSTLYFRIIRAASGEGHDGTAATGVLFSNTAAVFTCNEDFFSLQDLLVTRTANSVFDSAAVEFDGVSSSLIGVIMHNVTNSGGGGARGVAFYGTTQVAVNCLAYACTDQGFFIDATSVNLYNMTSANNGIGYRVSSGTVIAKNCVAANNTTGFSGTFSTSSITNASTGATVPGTSPYASQTFTFVDQSGADYHLHRNDLGATFRGTNLSADATFAFDDDIDGNTITYWNIGIDSSSTPQSSRRTGDNENVSTYAASGADYSVLADWEAFTDVDLVTGAVTEVLECAAGTYNDSLVAAGATTDGRYFRIIRPATGAEHGGIPFTGVVFSGTATNQFDIAENFFCVHDLVVITAANAAGNAAAIRVSATTQAKVVGCLTKATNAGAGSGIGILANNASGTSFIVNCLGWENDLDGFIGDGAGTKRFLNCTAINNGRYGFRRTLGTVTTINCLSDGNLTADFNGTMTVSDYNAATDATTTGSNSRNSQTFSYVNDAGNNYHLTAADTGALDFGIDMSTNVYYNYTDDIDEDVPETWSIGFDSLVASGYPPGHSYSHSIGNMTINGQSRSWSN